MDTDKFLHQEISEAVIGAAMKVLNTLKPGLNEKAYENALIIELTSRSVLSQQQSRFDVRYNGVVVDTLIPDRIVAGKIIVDAKVTEAFTPSHTAQMIGYLAVTRLRLALLLNFKFADLRWQRVVR